MSSIEVVFTCPACNAEHAGVLYNARRVDGELVFDVKPILDCPGCGLKPEEIEELLGNPVDANGDLE